MLGAIRKRKNSPVVLFILGLALLAMTAFGISTKGLGTASHNAASVNGEPISDADYSATYARVFSQKQRQDRNYSRTNAEKDRLRERVLDEMIGLKLRAQEAARLGFALDDDALRDTILGEEAFQVAGRFDKDLYERQLSGMRTTPELFEASQRERKLSYLLGAATRNVGVSDEEVKRMFFEERTRIVVDFVRFDPETFEGQVGEVSDADSAEWAKTKDAEEQIKNDYAKHKAKLYDVPEQVCARHVLVRMTKQLPPDIQAKKRKLIEDARTAVEKGMPFEEAARKFSEDTNKDRGGDLGCFSAGQTTQRIEEEAFKLQPGQISPVFETGFGLHFLKVTERKAPIRKKLEDVREEIIRALARRAKASDLAKAEASALLEEAKKLGSLEKGAEAFSKQAKNTKSYSVEKSQPFPQGRDFIPPLGVAPTVAHAAWKLTKEAPLAPEPLETERGWVVVALEQKETPTDEEFNAARPMLTWQLSQMKASALSDGWTADLRKHASVDVNPIAISYDDNVRAQMRR